MDVFLSYPTYYTVLECCNHSTTVTVNPNRYIVTRDTWDMARQRAGSALRDTLGMRYTVPIAMSSMESLAGFPVFVSTPHHYGNKDWGGASTSTSPLQRRPSRKKT